MDIDHIFIFTNDNGQVADELIDFGFTEGSSRVHTGQGTTNRKFYFESFFLEILWVHDESEIKSDSIKPTGLWQIADYQVNSFSRFGLCITNTLETNQVFKNAFKYQPPYFPQGMTIDILKNAAHPTLPWTFRLPLDRKLRNKAEPTNHSNGIKVLTSAIFEYKGSSDNKFNDFFKNEAKIGFKRTERSWLNLTFDNAQRGGRRVFKNLDLTIDF